MSFTNFENILSTTQTFSNKNGLNALLNLNDNSNYPKLTNNSNGNNFTQRPYIDHSVVNDDKMDYYEYEVKIVNDDSNNYDDSNNSNNNSTETEGSKRLNIFSRNNKKNNNHNKNVDISIKNNNNNNPHNLSNKPNSQLYNTVNYDDNKNKNIPSTNNYYKYSSYSNQRNTNSNDNRYLNNVLKKNTILNQASATNPNKTQKKTKLRSWNQNNTILKMK
ncbi:hypothetical protein TONV_106 [Tipula oleracea nudivirus]|uniref:Uncharacterized protein n=1 Tax=Tipula oleracea nudivirus TaxID=1546257 RepID=A0A0B4VGG0_9VIRU|nr:hypothetical protein TONV_106 [Tipula oleracea nudivirus]AJD20166.1 hypothetical protein TONV_106 [Tipula oleracea nudivirus]